MVKGQFGSVAKKMKELKKAKIAVYAVWAGEDLDEDVGMIVQDWLGGEATGFVIEDKIGIAVKSDWRKALVDLETMKVLDLDPSSGKGKSLDSMIKKCKSLD